MDTRGLIIVYTGNGKGKTTAAFGQALRAAGNGLAVAIIQFIKGGWETGEARAIAALGDRIELHLTGSGFTWQENRDTVIEKGLTGWKLAREKIISRSYGLVVLDELTYLLNYEILTEAEVLSVLKDRPPDLHVVITGRNAPRVLIEAADLVTEMKEIKHPYRQGIKAQRGVEY